MATFNTYVQNVLRVEVPITVDLAKLTIPVSEILRIAPGAIISVGRMPNDNLNIEANGVPIAKGILECDGNCIRVRITELAVSKHNIKTRRVA